MKAIVVSLLSAILVPAAAWSQAPSVPLWMEAADDVYLQEVNGTISTSHPVTHVATIGDEVFAIVAGTLHELDRDKLEVVLGSPDGLTGLDSVGGDLWVTDGNATYRLDGRRFVAVSEAPLIDLCLHRDAVYGATRTELFRFDGNRFVSATPPDGYLTTDTTMIMEDGTQILADPVRIGPIRRIASYSDTLYILRDNGLGLIEGETFVPYPIDWGALPSRTLRDMHAHGSRLFVATDRGLSFVRGMTLVTLTGEEGLPVEDTTCVASGFDGDVWLGTTTGAIRMTGEVFHYFGANHWLPGDGVNAIAVQSRRVYVATDGGLGVISYEPYTLAKKAAYYERWLKEWGHMRLGFTHKLYWSNEDNGWVREISDNDGGHTAHYLAAMAFKFAATGDPEARTQATNAFRAMVWLDDITPKDGFIARAIWSVEGDKGQRGMRGSGGLPAKWYPTDDGKWLWKGDTSSDEVVAHFYAVSLFHDLVANEEEKKRAARHLANISQHILDNGWVLRDMDGDPTRWGRWNPEYLLRPYGFEARGLNGMEAQSYMTTAYALTGDDVFARGLQQTIDWGYHKYTVRQRLTFPPESVVPWDDELAFRTYHSLLRYSEDPYLRSIYLRSLTRSWEILRREKLPFFNFTYGASTQNDCDIAPAVQRLREWSLDCVAHRYRNSHRADLAPEPGYRAYGDVTRSLSPRELAAAWGSRSDRGLDGGNGRSVTPPVGWLEDYWMGRYYGMISPPTVTQSSLVTVDPDPRGDFGAAPYNGPPRPDIR